jgi:hypothetical protein
VRFHPAILLLLAVFAGGGKRGRAQPSPGPRPGPPRPGPPARGEIPRAASAGGLDAQGWVTTRLLACVDYLVTLPELAGRPGGNVQDIATDIVAHWALETNWGKAEFNFNLGGIHSGGGGPYFWALDAGVRVRFVAWGSLAEGVRGYVDLLRVHFGGCWSTLTALPELPTSQWYDCLGAHGYYGVRGNYEAAHARVQELLAP